MPYFRLYYRFDVEKEVVCMYDALISLIGTPPSGSEILIYIFACIFALFLLDSVTSLFVAIFNRRR